VTRTPDPMDGGASRIHFTNRGWTLRDALVRDALVPEAVAVNRAATEPLTEAETRTLSRLLGKLIAVNGASTWLQRGVGVSAR
jgi:hypothetical protein